MMSLEAVPERSSSSWEDLEVDAFVLGLNTFGKNFTQVKQLLESKETGQLLSYVANMLKCWGPESKEQPRIEKAVSIFHRHGFNRGASKRMDLQVVNRPVYKQKVFYRNCIG